MNVLLLGVMPSPLEPILRKNNCHVLATEKVVSAQHLHAHTIDFVVSYRYRHIVKRDVLKAVMGRIINLHISLLPWNRGADPNLWSFLEDTPKGVTVHFMDEGIDTGDIIVQQHVKFDLEQETLATSYSKLNERIIQLFSDHWPQVVKGKMAAQKQPPGGTFHRTNDKYAFQHFLEEKGWHTPVKELVGKALSRK